MNWDQIETKWAEMTQRVRAGAPHQAQSAATAVPQDEPKDSNAANIPGDMRADQAAEITGAVTVE